MISAPAFSSLFPAALKSQAGEILARGQASVDTRQQSVEFRSDFVPLYPIGTPMEVVRLLDTAEIHRFWGKVYISNKRLMRLVSVQDELLPGSEKIYCCGMSLPASLRPAVSKAGGLLSLLQGRKPPKEAEITITSVTAEQLEFFCGADQQLEPGEEYILSARPSLPLPETTVQIRRSLPAGKNTNYTCVFASLDSISERALKQFMVDYNQENNKLF